MQKKTALLLILIGTHTVLGASSFKFFLDQRKEQQLRVSVESLVDRLSVELVDVHESLGNAQVALEERGRELEKIRAEKDALIAELSEKDSRIQEMRSELSQLKRGFKDIDLGKVVVSREPKKPRVEAAPAAPAAVTVPISAATEAPAAQFVPVIQPAAPLAAAQKANGEVLAVNREFNFVVVSLGSADGIQKGAVLALQTKNGVSNVRVDMVDEKTSAATIVEGPTDQVQIGDSVNRIS